MKRSTRTPASTTVLWVLFCCLSASGQIVNTQTDWSGGPGLFGPVQQWGDRCQVADVVAWRSIPGQLALSCAPLDQPIEHIIAGNAENPRGCAVGDVDGDGDMDVITCTPIHDYPHGWVYWWERESDGNWTQHVVDDDFYGAYHVNVADVDSDGDIDVLSAAYYGEADPPPPTGMAINGRYAWFENLAGDGSTWTQHLAGELFWGARYVDGGDLDGDGDVDIVGASELTDGVYEQDGDITWFENLDGDGTQWAQHDLETDRNSAEAHVADIDGDGHMDVISGEHGRIGWWENRNGDGTLWIKRYVTTQFGDSSMHLDVGDIDNDGDADVFGAAYHLPEIVWWENTAGSGSVWFARYVASGTNTRVIELEDIDGDGDLDAALSLGLTGGSAYWIENVSGNGTVWDARLITYSIEGGNHLAIGDVNDDGRLDAVVSHEDSSQQQINQVAWHDLGYFNGAGELVSSVLDGGVGRVWSVIEWNALVPPNGTLSVSVRSSDDPEDLGPFVNVPAPETDLAALVDPGAQYLQYKLELATTDSSLSPIVDHLSVERQVIGDFDGDDSVGLTDFSVFAECLNGPYVVPDPEPPTSAEECLQAFDFDLDQDVDLADLATFTLAFTGP
jgi:hypothetical protein